MVLNYFIRTKFILKKIYSWIQTAKIPPTIPPNNAIKAMIFYWKKISHSILQGEKNYSIVWWAFQQNCCQENESDATASKTNKENGELLAEKSQISTTNTKHNTKEESKQKGTIFNRSVNLDFRSDSNSKNNNESNCKSNDEDNCLEQFESKQSKQ